MRFRADVAGTITGPPLLQGGRQHRRRTSAASGRAPGQLLASVDVRAARPPPAGSRRRLPHRSRSTRARPTSPPTTRRSGATPFDGALLRRPSRDNGRSRAADGAGGRTASSRTGRRPFPDEHAQRDELLGRRRVRGRPRPTRPRRPCSPTRPPPARPASRRRERDARRSRGARPRDRLRGDVHAARRGRRARARDRDLRRGRAPRDARPDAALAYSATYTATVKGGPDGVRDLAGKPLAEDCDVVVLDRRAAAPPPNEGPGGPILVIVTSAANPFSRYYAEILARRGPQRLHRAPTSRSLTPALLAAYDVVVLGEMPLDAGQVAMLTDWVNGGGNLIAMRPGPAARGPARASRRRRRDARRRATSRSTPPPRRARASSARRSSSTAPPTATRSSRRRRRRDALLRRDHGDGATRRSRCARVGLERRPGGGVHLRPRALGRLTRQGNPAWAGQERDGASAGIRSDDLFFPDWVDLDKVAIPQADEQQRLLANLIEHDEPRPQAAAALLVLPARREGRRRHDRRRPRQRRHRPRSSTC